MTRFALSAGALGMLLAASGCTRDEPSHTAGHHGLEGWVPSKIGDEKRERKEIEALLEGLHDAYRRGDQAAAAARMEFPVLMITDDWKGEVLARSWDRETWMERMAPLFQHPAPEMQRVHQHDIFVVSDSLASVQDEQTVLLGKRKVTIRAASILVRKDRAWYVRATVEGGWGDSPIGKSAEAPPAAPAPGAASGAGEGPERTAR